MSDDIPDICHPIRYRVKVIILCALVPVIPAENTN